MKTSKELKAFVDSRHLNAAQFLINFSEKKFDFATSLFRAGEFARFALICERVEISVDNRTIIQFFDLFKPTLMVYTNKRLILTYFTVPKKAPKYETIDLNYEDNAEQDWDIVECKAGELREIIIRFDDGIEIKIAVSSKKSKYVNAEIRKFLNEVYKI